jgi:hypothetical protein
MIPADNLHNAFDDAIDEWHRTDGSVPIHEWLGLSKEEYSRFVTQPSVVLAEMGRHPPERKNP